MNELKPCPFCGGEAIITEAHSYAATQTKGFVGFYVRCSGRDCSIRIGRVFKIKEKAMFSWNTRWLKDRNPK